MRALAGKGPVHHHSLVTLEGVVAKYNTHLLLSLEEGVVVQNIHEGLCSLVC